MAPLRLLRKQLSKELAETDRDSVFALACELVDSGDSNARWIACEIVRDHRALRATLTTKEVERLGDGMASWVAVDTFGTIVSGIAWREGRISDACIHRWARSKDRWWRRSALVSTVPLNVRAQGGSGDAPRTLAVCQLLVDDRDDMVVKAMSWALRALSVRDAAAVEKFVAANVGRLAARVKREVANKLGSGLKNPRRRSVGDPS